MIALGVDADDGRFQAKLLDKLSTERLLRTHECIDHPQKNRAVLVFLDLCAHQLCSTFSGMSAASFSPEALLRPGRSSRSIEGTDGERTCSSIVLSRHTCAAAAKSIKEALCVHGMISPS
eukprot:4289785-Prymnesium_polylepis.1